jgi:hypothetical protein
LDQMDPFRNKVQIEIKDAFVKFIRFFMNAGAAKKRFPRTCSLCGRQFHDLAYYIRSTHARGHSMEDYRGATGKPFTMIHRHCDCGNTLALAFTGEDCLFLDQFWETISLEAERSAKSVREVVSDFVSQWELHVMSEHNHEC